MAKDAEVADQQGQLEQKSQFPFARDLVVS